MLRNQAAWTSKLVEGVQTDQLGLGTPCTDWTVRDVINNLCIGGAVLRMLLADQPERFPIALDLEGAEHTDLHRRLPR